MQNFVQPGEVVTLTAPYDLDPGQGLLVGSIFGVASDEATIGSEVEAALTGVFDLTKTTGEAWTQGVRIYWNDTDRACTTTATANTLVGVALSSAASSAVIGRVRLNAAF